MKNKILSLIYIFVLALFMAGCATKSTADKDEPAAPKSEPRMLTVVNEVQDEEQPEQPELPELPLQEEDQEEITQAASTPAHTFVTEIRTEEGTTWLINIADIAQRISFSKLSADNYDLNYQAVLPLSLSFWGRELPKAGDTVMVSFTGTSNKSVPAPVFAGLLGNGFGTQMEFWDNLVSFDDDEENYILFTQDIKAGQLFTATATFRVYEDCQNNIALHIVYPLRDDTSEAVWGVSN